MKTGLWGIASGAVAIGVLSAGTARAQDRCELFDSANLTGTAKTIGMSGPVTGSSFTGSPGNGVWGNTSSRASGPMLGSMNNAATSLRIRAVDSDVALYYFDGDNFNGQGEVMHCKKGLVCSVNLTGMNNRTSSVICQREFFRKAKVSDPNADPLTVALAALSNPIINLTSITTQVDAKTQQLVAAEPQVDEFRPTWSEDGWQLWSHTTWITEWEYCRRYSLACASEPGMNFKDYFQISKRFEVEINGEPFTADDDYVIEFDYFIRPVIWDHDNNPATVEQLRFWWGLTDYFFEPGDAQSAIIAAVKPKIDSIPIQQELRNGVVQAAAAAGVPGVFDDKHRLQLSLFTDSNVGKNVWIEAFDMSTTHPKLVLNQTRDANYL